MRKSDFDTLFSQGDAVINRIREEPLERLQRIGSDLWVSQIADWQDLAKAEDSVRREYSGRYLFELLQNANDAIVDWLIVNSSKSQPTHLIFAPRLKRVTDVTERKIKFIRKRGRSD